MQNRELDLIPVLLGIVGVSGVYALLILVSVSNLTTIEVAILLQTVQGYRIWMWYPPVYGLMDSQ
jgi:hypothetical protein